MRLATTRSAIQGFARTLVDGANEAADEGDRIFMAAILGVGGAARWAGDGMTRVFRRAQVRIFRKRDAAPDRVLADLRTHLQQCDPEALDESALAMRAEMLWNVFEENLSLRGRSPQQTSTDVLRSGPERQ